MPTVAIDNDNITLPVNDAGNAGNSPRIWLLSGYRAGERSQILALGEALGWPFEIKDIHHRKTALRTNLFRGSDLSGVDLQSSSSLVPQWPDVVIAAGLRNEPVCRWIKAQSGGNTLIVHIGKPWADPSCFDLVITTPQYRLPQRPNVLQNTMTMHGVRAESLASEAAALRPKIVDVPEPYIAVIVGGDSGPYTFGPRAAKRLAAEASRLAKAKGASLLVTTSARTRPDVAALLRDSIEVPAVFYDWSAGDPDNPYFGYLGLADEIIVTMDSISMLSEACATGKPVYMFNFDAKTGGGGQTDFRPGAVLYRWLMGCGPNKLTRDISIVHRQLLDKGYACWLGDEQSSPSPPPSPQDLERAIARTKQLLGDKAIGR